MGGADLGVLSFYSKMSDAAGGDSTERRSPERRVHVHMHVCDQGRVTRGGGGVATEGEAGHE